MSKVDNFLNQPQKCGINHHQSASVCKCGPGNQCRMRHFSDIKLLLCYISVQLWHFIFTPLAGADDFMRQCNCCFPYIWLTLSWTDIFPKSCHFFFHFQRLLQSTSCIVPPASIGFSGQTCPGQSGKLIFINHINLLYSIIQ